MALGPRSPPPVSRLLPSLGTIAITLINTGYFIPYVHLVAHLRTWVDPLPAAFRWRAISDLVGRGFWVNSDAVPGPVARLLML